MMSNGEFWYNKDIYGTNMECIKLWCLIVEILCLYDTINCIKLLILSQLSQLRI